MEVYAIFSKRGPEVAASLASPNIHHCGQQYLGISGIIAYPILSASDAFLRVRRINIERKIKK